MQNSDDIIASTNVTPHDIATRLAALNRWQEEQKRLLEERQKNQRLMLGLEQRNMYQMLGLLHNDKCASDDEEEDQDIQEEEQEQQSLAIQLPRHVDCEQEQDESEHELQLAEYVSGQNSPHLEKPKRTFLRRGEGLKKRFKIDPDKFRVNNLPHYKFANSHPQLRTPAKPLVKQQKQSILKTQKQPVANGKAMPQMCLDKQEKRFQQILMNAKTVCSSTPDLKSSYASSSSISPKVRFVEVSDTASGKGQSADDEQSSCGASSVAMTNMCWAQVLGSQQIKPPMLHRRSAQIRVENDDNVSIFELLEQKAREGNIDMNSSCIRTFMARKEQRTQFDVDDDSDRILVTKQLRDMRLQPEVAEVIQDEDEENTNITMTPTGSTKTQVRVRFSDSNDTHEYSDGTTLQDGSNVQLFEEFKTALFQALDKRKTQQARETAAVDPLEQELQTKAQLVRTRLQELETEIATFKDQNAQLLRLKQQHEMEKAKYAQDHQEAMDCVHDEKIKAEIYLHDERMKIEEERRKFEQQMRLQKCNMNTKEKKQLAALQEEIESLKTQLKQKEQAHVSAQARLRAQLRAGEKEQRGYRDEIELLGRENKRLEQELVKLTRETNSKMLQEINRNIARLAPKLEAVTPPATRTEEISRRQSKSLGDVQEKSAKQRVSNRRQSFQRTRKLPEPLNEGYASSSSCEMEELLPTPAAAKSTSAEKNNNKCNENKNKENDCSDNEKDNSNNEYKREIVNTDGSKDVWYTNGNLKKISADGMTVRMLYFNKDIKETDIRAGTVKYYYAETNTWHTTYLDGLEILEFPNGQIEHRHKNGTVEIHFPNQTIKTTDPNDTEKLEDWRYADGTHLVQLRNGDKILNLPNGQKEITTKLNKRREYPDGTVKIVYPDGSQETRYSNGRVRLKDKDGKLLMDTDYAKY